MINILVHGLGQTDKSWDKVKGILNQDNINIETPNLFEIAKNYQLTYENVFTVFVDYCNSFSDKLNLVGLSLGGILAIDYAILHPEKVNSITLCGVPYEMPKKLLKIQNFIFKFMPKRTFDNIGISKENFMQLTNSMAELNIKEKLSKMNDEEKVELLSSDGMLIKRPLLITDDRILIGFKEKEWEELLK